VACEQNCLPLYLEHSWVNDHLGFNQLSNEASIYKRRNFSPRYARPSGEAGAIPDTSAKGEVITDERKY